MTTSVAILADLQSFAVYAPEAALRRQRTLMSETGHGRRIGRKQGSFSLRMRKPAPAALTAAEAKAAIEALPPVGWLRLHKIARALCRHNRIDATDLLQEAFQRVLDGRRRCPSHIDIVRFLAGVMRSVASDWSKSRRRWRQLSLAATGTLHDTVLHVRDPRPDPLDAVVAEQEAACMLQATRDLFADDTAALRMLEGMLDGIEGEALRSLTDLDETEFASKRRLIRRRIDKAFPKDHKS